MTGFGGGTGDEIDGMSPNVVGLGGGTESVQLVSGGRGPPEEELAGFAGIGGTGTGLVLGL